MSCQTASSQPFTALSVVDPNGNEIVVEIRRSNGYVNATKLCQTMGKDWNSYYTNPKTVEFLAEFSKFVKFSYDATEKALIRIGTSESPYTWVHPDVAVHMAQSASVFFGVAVSCIVRRYQTDQDTAKNLAKHVCAPPQDIAQEAELVTLKRLDLELLKEKEKTKRREISAGVERARIDAEVQKTRLKLTLGSYN